MGSRSRARARAQASQLSPRPSPGGQAHPTQRSANSPATPPPAASLPRTVLAAAVIEMAEAVLVLVAALWAGIATASGHSYQTSSGVAITIIGVGTACLLALVARGLRRARRWSRTPAVLTQVFTGIVAVYLLQSGRLEWGVPAIVLAVAGLAALLAPASINVLTPGRTHKG